MSIELRERIQAYLRVKEKRAMRLLPDRVTETKNKISKRIAKLIVERDKIGKHKSNPGQTLAVCIIITGEIGFLQEIMRGL